VLWSDSVFSKPLEFLEGQASATKNAFEGFAFEDQIAMNWNDRLTAVGFAAEDIVAASRAVNSTGTRSP
jgi:hypothetical protein